jgi:cell pole-organizing protein PopZ
VAVVRREIDHWLDSELETLVRRRVQEALSRQE